MKELEEALMDRTTASLNRRQRITSINPPSMTGMVSDKERVRKYSCQVPDHTPDQSSSGGILGSNRSETVSEHSGELYESEKDRNIRETQEKRTSKRNAHKHEQNRLELE